jgi:DNA-binding transcriptional MerR regulator
MLTVSKLARSCGLSRGTLLYYESIGLLRPASRSAAGYRRYGDKDAARLRRILVYRDAGIALADIRTLLDRPGNDASSVLKRRLEEIHAEIERLRGHQAAILKLLRTPGSLWRTETMTKDKWVTIMKAAGLSEDDMRRWHVEFEKAAPEEHQEFLEYLHIPGAEIGRIREWSRGAA